MLQRHELPGLEYWPCEEPEPVYPRIRRWHKIALWLALVLLAGTPVLWLAG
jgi:hypothetical protein